VPHCSRVAKSPLHEYRYRYRYRDTFKSSVSLSISPILLCGNIAIGIGDTFIEYR
jgi:hypothetical protein